MRNRVNVSVRSAKRAYFEDKLNLNQAPKKLWSNLHKLGVCGKDVVTCDVNPNVMNNFFLSAPIQASSGNSQQSSSVVESTNTSGFSFRCIDETDVVTVTNGIGSSAVGPDGIPPRFIKLILPLILPVLVHVFNSCLTSSQFPVLWKSASVVPVSKSGKCSEPSDFRPISILCFLAKVLEKFMCSQLASYYHQENLLSCWQSGFRAGHSCETALLKITSDIGKALDKDHMAVLVLLDFSKAFDSIDHNKLLSKLYQSFNLSSSAIAMITNFLRNRCQSVKTHLGTSLPLSVPCGIPQGSVLGPLLFCSYINDLPLTIKDASVHLYADDVQIYLDRPIGLIEDCIARINDDLHRIWEWSQCNNLVLNPNKSTCIAVYRRIFDLAAVSPIMINNTIIPYATTVSSLGIQLNRLFTCCSHVSHKLGKIYSCLRGLRLSASLLSYGMRLKLARALILPHFTFGSLVYSKLDSNCKRRLDVAFNDTIRFIHGLRRYSHISAYVDSFVGCSLETYLVNRRLKFLYNLIYTKQPGYLYGYVQFLSSTRQRNILIPRFRSSIGERSFFVQTVRCWNSLPVNVQLASSVAAFGRHLAATRTT